MGRFSVEQAHSLLHPRAEVFCRAVANRRPVTMIQMLGRSNAH
jgi:hypothetical protein